ncbi:MAG: dienelactone hydrolase [Marivirga sp.]|jgi:hypothetical protein
MKKKHLQIKRWLKGLIKAIAPGNNAVRGASLGLLTVTAILWVVYSVRSYRDLNDQWALLLSIAIILSSLLFGLINRWVLKLISKISAFYKLALLTSIPLLVIMSLDSITPSVILILASLCGAALLVLKNTGFKNLSRAKKTVTVLGILIGFGGFIAGGVLYGTVGFAVHPVTNAALASKLNIHQIKGVSPSEKGPYTVKMTTYGSGNDLHRPEYGEEVAIKTDSVNGLAFIDNWKGIGGWFREKYWGFDARALPINARVWYPEGEGPFPLALIVHGNHSMQDYSDPGYAYLGELLASKGIILASVDENFINGSWSDIFGGLDEENDARAWLLLEHLKVWHEWNETEDNVFYKKIDTSNIALIGHSRGGESVAHAAMFNKLPFYPDDASVKFDYNYNIKSIMAIAPVDGQYEPGNSKTVVEDVSYFVMHGAQDADVTSFLGSQQYERVNFKDSLYHFKSGIYVYGANHGQFNTSWGDNDMGNPFVGFLNRKQLLSAEDQREIAQVYISSFLAITLKDKQEYLPLFVDARAGKDWLPETIYLNQFEDSNLKIIADFDEDFDVSTSTQDGGSIITKNLSVWREQEVQLKWQKKGSRALIIGWNYEQQPGEHSIASLPDSTIANYTISLPSTMSDSTSVLVFSLAEAQESAQPKSEGKWVNNDNKKNKEEEALGEEKDEEDEEEPKQPIDFTILLRDTMGQEVSFPLSTFSALQRTIEVTIMKVDFVMDGTQSEKVFQTFYFPTMAFQEINPHFSPSDIKEVQFIFNKNTSGVIAIDNIGFMKRL